MPAWRGGRSAAMRSWSRTTTSTTGLRAARHGDRAAGRPGRPADPRVQRHDRVGARQPGGARTRSGCRARTSSATCSATRSSRSIGPTDRSAGTSSRWPTARGTSTSARPAPTPGRCWRPEAASRGARTATRARGRGRRRSRVHGDPRSYPLDPGLMHRDVSDSAEFIGSIDAPLDAARLRLLGGARAARLVARGRARPRGRRLGARRPRRDPAPRRARRAGAQRLLPVRDPAVHGRGIAAYVLDEAKALAARVAPGRDLLVRTRPGNAAARRVAERAGFRDLGRSPSEDDTRNLAAGCRSARLSGDIEA